MGTKGAFADNWKSDSTTTLIKRVCTNSFPTSVPHTQRHVWAGGTTALLEWRQALVVACRAMARNGALLPARRTRRYAFALTGRCDCQLDLPFVISLHPQKFITLLATTASKVKDSTQPFVPIVGMPTCGGIA